jgi:uncharacterized protein
MKATEQGHDIAQHNVGLCYNNGDGVKQDLAKARYWYMKAAEQGYIPAQELLEGFGKTGR